MRLSSSELSLLCSSTCDGRRCRAMEALNVMTVPPSSGPLSGCIAYNVTVFTATPLHLISYRTQDRAAPSAVDFDGK